MKCENCVACKSFFDGVEEYSYCDIGISDDKAYNEGRWCCKLNQKTITKRLKEKYKLENRKPRR